MRKRKILVSLLAVVMTAAVAMFAFSCKKQSETPKNYGEAGLYYCEAVNGDEYALSLAGSKIAMTTTEETVAGTYSYDGKTFKVTFAGESASEGKLEDNVLTITYKGSTYTFYKNVKYTASFSVDGTVKETAKVTNGKKLVKPADPQKADNNFVGWYSNAEYTAPYDFNLPVLGDVTLYARFAPATPGESEFNAKLMADDKVYGNVKTIGGVIYHLPVLEAKAGKEFSGWYVSDYQSAEKLTYKYDGRKLAADTTLYAVWKSAAPEVTISESGKVVWTVKGGVTGYAVKVYQGKNEEPVHTQNDVSGEVSYNFANAEAGDYKITVSDGSNETAVYYKNKVLARVSQFEVVEPGVLVWNEVAGADKYLVTVNCGTEGHTHKDFDNGKSTNYNFANCDMKQGGITFEVKAVAAGRATSVSEAFVYNRELEKVTGLQIKNDVAYWNKVAGAASYVVTVKKVGEDEVTENVGNSTSYSLKDYTGSVSVSVVPVTKGYNSPEAASAVYTKTTLSAPAGVKVVGNKIVWEEVADAKGYVVKIGSAVKNITGGSVTECEITDADVENVSEIKVTVQALANNTANNSAESDEVVAAVGKMSSAPVYAAGVVSWGAVYGASKYEVTVNNGKINAITDGSTTFNANLDKAGNNEIVVKAFKDGAKEGEYVYVCEGKVTVKAYTVTIDVRGGTDVEKQYVAYGDELTIPSTKYYGYDFKGWYNLPGGAADNGKLFENGATYDYASNMILYAYWEPAVVDVIFDTMGIGSMKADDLEENEIGQLVYKVTFGKSYKLPVPDGNSVVSSTTFGGWYAEPNGQGDKYADESGLSSGVWDDAQTITLFAAWFETLTYTKVYNQDTGDYGYSVTKGPDISKVTTVKVPDKYTDGLPVTTVEMDAFKDCKNLIEVQIPDSIQNVETGYVTSDGVEISAFSGCTNLEKVTVYEVSGNHDKLWSSRDGVLFYNNVIANEGLELRYVPAALKPSAGGNGILTEYNNEAGETCTQFNVPNEVVSLPFQAFAKLTFTRIVIPYSVVKVNASAFNATKCKEIIFEATPAGQTEKPLTIAADTAFKSCEAETIVLPSRLSETNFPAIFGSCAKLKAIGFSGTGGRYEAASLTADVKATLPDGSTVACGLVVDKSNAANKVVVFSPLKYSVDQANSGKNIIVIPDNIAEIGEKAFYSASIDGIVISESVTKIGTSAFENCVKLTSLVIKQAETDNEPLELGERSFMGCKLLGPVEFPERTAVIGAKAFSYSSSYGGKNSLLTSVTFKGNENGTLRIDDNAFQYCAKLNTVTFGKSLKYVIGTSAFDNTTITSVSLDCTDVEIASCAFFATADKSTVTSLNLGANVGLFDIGAAFGPKITTSALKIDSSNKNYSVESGVVYNGDKTKLVYYPAGLTAKSYKTPDTVTSIAPYACVGNTGMNSLTEFIIGKNVTEVGEAAFRYNTTAKTISFEEGEDAKKLTLGEYSFADAAFATNYTISGRASEIKDFAFYNSTNGTRGFKTITLGAGVEVIGEHAFEKCSQLTSVSLPASVREIRGEDKTFAFYNCDKFATISVADGGDYYGSKTNALYSKKDGKFDVLLFVPKMATGEIVIANTITKIAENLPKTANSAGAKGLSVSSISFDGDLENELEIGDLAFFGSKNLASVTLANGITKIGKQAFGKCPKLENVVIPKTVSFIGQQAFLESSKVSSVTFEYDDSVADELLTFEDDSTKIYGGSGSFGIFYKSAVKQLTLPDRPIYIGQGAFANMPAIQTVTLNSARIENFGIAAFSNCVELTKIDGLDKVTLTEIPEYAFNLDAKLVFEFPKGVERIGAYSLGGSLSAKGIANESIVIPATVKTIDSNAFQGAQVVNVSFEKGSVCETIGDTAFSSCSNLKSITFPDSLKTIGGYSGFYGTAIESVTIPASVETIRDNAFFGAAMLKSITFAENSKLKEIGDRAFSGTAITSFSFPETSGSIKIDSNATLFQGCSLLSELHISSSVPDITAAIANCPSIKHIYVDENNKNFSTNEEHTMLLNANKTAIKYICGVLDEETVSITEGIKTIGARVFSGQWKVKKFIIPESVRVIDDRAFENCVSLTEIELKKNGSLVEIGSSVFAGCKNLAKVTLPETVTKMGDEAFRYSSVQEVYIPDSVTTIGKQTFYGVTTLNKVTGMGGLTSIPEYMFYGSGITTVEIGESCTAIQNYAFQRCKNLVSVSGMKNVANIGRSAFEGCESLREIALSDKIRTITDNAFINCSSLSTVTGLDEITDLSAGTFKNCTSLKTISLPSVTTVGNEAFAGSGVVTASLPKATKLGLGVFDGCAALENVTLCDDLTDIGQRTFRNCVSLESITLPKNLTNLNQRSFMGSGLVSIELPVGIDRIDNASTKGDGAFANCGNLESVTVNGKLTNVGTYAFYGCNKLASFDFTKVDAISSNSFEKCGFTSIDLTGVKTIAEYAFPECSKLASLTGITEIPDHAFEKCAFESLDLSNVTSLGASAFAYNTSLETVIIGSRLPYVAERAFYNCSALNSVTLNNGVAEIKNEAFAGCSALTAIELPASVISVESSAFRNCSLTEVTITDGLIQIGNNAFDCATLTEYKGGNTVFTVTDGVLYRGGELFAYPAAKVVEEGASVVVSELYEYAFYKNKNVKKVSLQSRITEIPAYAFANSSIEEINIPSTVERISMYAFYGCDKLKTVTFEEDENGTAFESIGNYAFSDCSSLSALKLPETLSSVGDSAFARSGLTAMTLPVSCGVFGVNLFYGCQNLTSVNILSADITTIPEGMFANCLKLEDVNTPENEEPFVNIPENITGLGHEAFRASGVKKVVLPVSVKAFAVSGSVDRLASYFEDCANLTDVEFKGKVTDIGMRAFYNCEKLVNIKFAGGSIGSDGTIVLPDTLVNIGSAAFKNCGISGVELPVNLVKLGGSVDLSLSTPDTVATMNIGVFQNCKNLKKVTIKSKGITTGGAAFMNCDALESVTFSGTAVKKVPVDYMFASCDKLASVNFGSLTELPRRAFYACSSLKSIEIPTSLLKIGEFVFSDCGLTSVSFAKWGSQQLNLGRGAFKGCSALTRIDLPNMKAISVTVSGTPECEWFMDCSLLETVTFKNGVNVLGKNIFSGCSALKTVKLGNADSTDVGIYIPENVIIGNYAFNGVGEGATITFETNYYYTLGVWDANWASGCKATIVMDNVIMNPYLF